MPSPTFWTERIQLGTCLVLVDARQAARRHRDAVAGAVSAEDWPALEEAARAATVEFADLMARLPRSTGSGVVAPLLIALEEQLREWRGNFTVYDLVARNADQRPPEETAATIAQAEAALETAKQLFERKVLAAYEALKADNGFVCDGL